MTYAVYEAKCMGTGKSYVGVTKRTAAVRFGEELLRAMRGSNGCRALDVAIRKYGKGAFAVRVICEPRTFTSAQKEEARFINALNTLHPDGLNLYTGGTIGRVATEPVRSAMRRRMQRLYSSPEARRRQSEATKAGITVRSRRRRSVVLKQRWKDPEFREKMLRARLSLKGKALQSKVMRRLWDDAQWRSKQLMNEQYLKKPPQGE